MSDQPKDEPGARVFFLYTEADMRSYAKATLHLVADTLGVEINTQLPPLPKAEVRVVFPPDSNDAEG